MEEIDKLKVSVIIPTYMRGKELCRLLEQLLTQDRPADEILVINQTPEHEPETKGLLECLSKENKIRLFQQDMPHSTIARNHGIKESKGDILIVVDDDVLVEKDFIKAHLANYEDENISGVSGVILSKANPALSDEAPQEVFSEPLGWEDLPFNYGVRRETILMVGCNFSIRKHMAMKIRGFDTNFMEPFNREDSDFSWRVYCAGGVVVRDPLAKVFHLYAPYGGCRFSRDKWHLPFVNQLQNDFYYYIKNFLGKYPLQVLFIILKGFRQWVLNKGNIVNPYFLFLAGVRFSSALTKAVYLVLRGPRLIDNDN